MHNSTKDLAVLTLVHHREQALRNMLNGIAVGSLWPNEVIIIFMNEEPWLAAETYPFPIRSIVLNTEEGMNLSAARNLAMQETSCNHAIFLDVDCIPDSDFIKIYQDCFDHNDQVLYTGRVQYLPAGFDQQDNWSTRLATISAPDPIRANLATYPYELFWSLNFACSKSVFQQIGGFDSEYKGYGGEDTDFAFHARNNVVALHTVDAFAYHQYHASYSPPLNHIESICQNASRFFSKWGVWPMEGWISSFVKGGFVKKEKEQLEIVRLPTAAEIKAALK